MNIRTESWSVTMVMHFLFFLSPSFRSEENGFNAFLFCSVLFWILCWIMYVYLDRRGLSFSIFHPLPQFPYFWLLSFDSFPSFISRLFCVLRFFFFESWIIFLLRWPFVHFLLPLFWEAKEEMFLMKYLFSSTKRNERSVLEQNKFIRKRRKRRRMFFLSPIKLPYSNYQRLSFAESIFT